MSETTEVRPGQVWADNGKRSAGRHVKVLQIDGRRARVVACRADGEVVGRPRETFITLVRMRPTSTGYRLVQDAER